VQILRDAGRLLLRLSTEPSAFTDWWQLTVSGVPVETLQAWVAEHADAAIISQILTDDDCVLIVAPDQRAVLEQAIVEARGISVAEPFIIPVNTGPHETAVQEHFAQFFTRHVTCEPQIPFYSAVDARPMGTSIDAVVSGLTEQMAAPVDFRAMIRRMYADGYRIFVEVGARGLLTPLISKILADQTDEPPAVIPMQILHR
jgi:acyl transferase domain-containing protein